MIASLLCHLLSRAAAVAAAAAVVVVAVVQCSSLLIITDWAPLFCALLTLFVLLCGSATDAAIFFAL